MVSELDMLEAPAELASDVTGRRRRATVVVIAVVASAALVWFGTGLTPIPWLTWLAPIPIFAVATRVRGRVAAIAGFVAWAAGSLTMWTYYAGTLEVPIGVVIGFLVIQALVFSGVVVVFRTLARRGNVVLAALAAPALWAGTEYLVSLFSPGGSFGSIGYTQSQVLPVIQVASVTGVSGVSFLLMTVPALAAALLIRRTAWPRLLATATVLAVATLGWGVWQLQTSASGTAVTAALIDVRQSEDSLPIASPEAQKVLNAYLAAVPAVAASGATIAVLPEKVFKVDAAELDGLGRQLTAVAAQNRITIVVGVTLKDAIGVHNVAMAYTGDGSSRYDKQHLVTGWEDQFTPGDHLTVLPGTRMGLAICKDLDHPQLPRQYAQQGTTMLLVPALDFGRDGWLHSRIAVVRGVENGVTVLRPAGHGRLTASDSHGRLLTDVPTGSTDTTVTTVAVHSGSSGTPYGRFGDWFAWICLALAAAALLRLRITL